MTLFRKTKKKTKIRGKKGFHVISSVSNSNEIYEQFGDVKVNAKMKIHVKLKRNG